MLDRVIAVLLVGSANGLAFTLSHWWFHRRRGAQPVERGAAERSDSPAAAPEQFSEGVAARAGRLR